jgi:kinesin family protein C1
MSSKKQNPLLTSLFSSLIFSAVRVQQNKKRGQLLVFSPTLTNRASGLPDSPDDEASDDDVKPAGDDMDDDNDTAVDDSVEELASDEEQDNASEQDLLTPRDSVEELAFDGEQDDDSEQDRLTPRNMEVDVPKSDSMSFATSASHHNSEQITNEFKSLAEKIDKLMAAKSAEPQQQQQQLVDMQSAKTESLAMTNSELSKQCERLQSTVKELGSKITADKETFLEEKTRLEAELGSSTRSTDTRIQELKELITTLETQLTSLQNDKESLSNQVVKVQSDVSSVREKLTESQRMLKGLKEEHAAEMATLKEEHAELADVNCNVNDELNTLKEQNERLEKLITEYESTIDALENTLLPESEAQLEEALEKVRHYEETVESVSDTIPNYEERIRALERQLDTANREKEEERANFQCLNEDSSTAYETMTTHVAAKDDEVERFKIQLDDSSQQLEKQRAELETTSTKLAEIETSLNGKVVHLETALEDTMTQLENSEQERRILSKKLNEALERIKEDAVFKEDVLNENKSNAAAMKETESQRAKMQRRIAELENNLQSTTEQRDDAMGRLSTYDQREDDLFMKLRESDRVRRQLHNKVIQLSGNIRVFVRIRPALPGEEEAIEQSKPSTASNVKKRNHAEIEQQSLFSYPGMYDRAAKKSSTDTDDDLTKNLLEVTEPFKDRGGLSDRRKQWKFGFDGVFNPNHGQDDIWEAAEPLVQSAIDGYNVTIFAYGQTGSGKTYTMLGEADNKGLISRSISKLFSAKQEIEALSRGDTKVELSVELLEVYNEKIRDLLAPNGGTDGRELNLKVTSKSVVGNVVLPAQNETEVAKILDKAQNRRCVKATASNAVSSRSHMLFTLHFKTSSKSGVSREGKLNICDLAGSERLSKSNANAHVGGALLKETKCINSSLSALSNVIEKLQAGDSNVPFRESKLTFLLQNSLGGNSKTLAIVCCNPLQSHFHESLCSLRFAEKVNKVDLKAVANFSC